MHFREGFLQPRPKGNNDVFLSFNFAPEGKYWPPRYSISWQCMVLHAHQVELIRWSKYCRLVQNITGDFVKSKDNYLPRGQLISVGLTILCCFCAVFNKLVTYLVWFHKPVSVLWESYVRANIFINIYKVLHTGTGGFVVVYNRDIRYDDQIFIHHCIMYTQINI